MARAIMRSATAKSWDARVRAAWLGAVAAAGLSATPGGAATPDEIDAAIARGVKYLYGAGNFPEHGHWEEALRHNPNDTQWAGRTALCAYALLAAGESSNHPQLRRAIGFLRNAEMTGFYAIGLRAQIWQYLPQSPDNRKVLARDFEELKRGIEKRAGRNNTGLYDYDATPARRAIDRVDLSVSQYGVLGMWACADLNLEVPTGRARVDGGFNYWDLVEKKWRALQDKETGGWSYTLGSGVTPSMTAAGVATLFVTQEFLHARDGLTCTGNANYPELEKGIAYLARALPKVYDPAGENDHYTVYGIERVGVASGLKFIGDIDWYHDGADFLLKTQKPDGRWSGKWGGDEGATAYALLFLSRGREPVTFNKIRYTNAPAPGTAAEGASRQGLWNQRARDVANASRYVGKQMERTFNWQLLDLDVATVDDLHDAPVAYLAGGQRLSLTPANVAKLKQYVEEGGLLVFSTDCNRRAFATSVVKLLEEMFPGRTVRPLERSSVLFTGQQFKATTWRQQPAVKAIGNGVREFALLLGDAENDDVGKTLQTNEATIRNDHFALMANIYQYAIDKTHMQVKGRNHVLRDDPALPTTRAIKVARLLYAGNADPEPGGWRRLSALLRREHQVRLDVTPVQLGASALDGFEVAHLTGTGPARLEAPQLAALKAFVAGGGLLVIDAAGGDEAFASSIGGQLASIHANADAAGGELIPGVDPLFTAGGTAPPALGYRLFAGVIGDAARRPSLRGVKVDGRWGILFSAEDLSAGLVGNHVDGIRGYTPEAATQIMTRILLYARDAKK